MDTLVLVILGILFLMILFVTIKSLIDDSIEERKFQSELYELERRKGIFTYTESKTEVKPSKEVDIG